MVAGVNDPAGLVNYSPGLANDSTGLPMTQTN